MRRVGGLAALDRVLYEAQRSNRDDVSTTAVLSRLRCHAATVIPDLAHCWTIGGQPTPNSGYWFCEPTCVCSLVRQLNDVWTAASMRASMLTHVRKGHAGGGDRTGFTWCNFVPLLNIDESQTAMGPSRQVRQTSMPCWAATAVFGQRRDKIVTYGEWRGGGGVDKKGCPQKQCGRTCVTAAMASVWWQLCDSRHGRCQVVCGDCPCNSAWRSTGWRRM